MSDPAARVCILMCTYNGARYLPDQLQSFAAQTHGAWDLLVSDDGSTDETQDLVRGFAKQMAPSGHDIRLVAGPKRGACANFLAALGHAPDTGAWLAWSDQDDVWLPDRLALGLNRLQNVPSGRPAIYCSATWITDANLKNHRRSRAPARALDFRNALIQNVVSGNTVLMNPAAAALARQLAPTDPLPAMHDWWLYQLIAGHGGQVIFDPRPTLIYRQHSQNEIGANDSWRARARRIKMVLQGRFQRWNTANITVLLQMRAHLSVDNQARLDRFWALRQKGLVERCRAFAGLGLYRQTTFGQFSIWLALVLGRL